MSQEDLARMLFVSRQTISLWEKGQTVPTVDNLLRLREIFCVSADKILVGEENMEIEPEDDIEEENTEATEALEMTEPSAAPEEVAEPDREKETETAKGKPLLRTILLLAAGVLCGTCCILLWLLPIHTGFLVGCFVGVSGTVGFALLVASVMSARSVIGKGKRWATVLLYPVAAVLLCGVALICSMTAKTPQDRLSARLSISLPKAMGVSIDASREDFGRMRISTRTEVYFSGSDAAELAKKLDGAEEWKTADEWGAELAELFVSFDFLSGGDVFCLFNLSDSEKGTVLSSGDEYIAAAFFCNEGMLRIVEFSLS